MPLINKSTPVYTSTSLASHSSNFRYLLYLQVDHKIICSHINRMAIFLYCFAFAVFLSILILVHLFGVLVCRGSSIAHGFMSRDTAPSRMLIHQQTSLPHTVAIEYPALPKVSPESIAQRMSPCPRRPTRPCLFQNFTTLLSMNIWGSKEYIYI